LNSIFVCVGFNVTILFWLSVSLRR